MSTLRDLYAAHDGKVSDKWTLYLDEYERVLAPWRSRPIRLLEIGVQNGGSLEIWSKYFPEAQRIVGCDINPDCAKLTYEDSRVGLVVGDANLDETERRIVALEPTFDLVIDDGSHRSSDIVRSFARWFPRLADGGLYIAEDLHCGYWREFEGGLHDPHSSLAFFKTLSDLPSQEHWGLSRSRSDELESFASRYALSFDDEVLSRIHSIELLNSMAIVRKAAPSKNELGTRVIAGKAAAVMPQVTRSGGSKSNAPAQSELIHGALTAELKGQTAALHEEVVAMRAALAAREGEIADLRRALQVRDGDLRAKEQAIALVTGSTSWKLTQPIRSTSKVVRSGFFTVGPRVWRTLPARYQDPILRWGYRNLAPLFEGHQGFEAWRQSSHQTARLAPRDASMVEIASTPAASRVEGSIAIHLHVFYDDLAEELCAYVAHMPFDFDLYVSVRDAEGEAVCRRVFATLARCRALKLAIVPNRGRDIAPMFVAFGADLARYDYVAHLHSKKSLYNQGATEGWRQYLFDNLLGNEEQIRRVFTLLASPEPRGIVYPQNYFRLSYTCNTWLANRGIGAAWCARLGIEPIPSGYFDFPAGSMFWARGDALRPLFRAGIELEDFADEAGQTDGTFAHCLERLLVLTSRKQGMEPGILADEVHTTWSAWRIDQYMGRTSEFITRTLGATRTKVIGFDIFDTLVSRPLIDAEATKQIVARRLGDVGPAYLANRAGAENDARRAANRDVGLDAVYEQLGRRTGFDRDALSRARAIEEQVELACLQPRKDLVETFHAAVQTGKPVVIMTDMFLPRARIEAALRSAGISGFAELLVSNETGLRKDTGATYDDVYTRYRIAPTELLMFGDNERSDIQIPSDKGALAQHVLRPTEMARAWPRFQRILEQHEHTKDIDAQLTLGLVVRKSFQSFLPPHPDPTSLIGATPFRIGYGIAGPLLVAFSSWLLDAAERDGVERLYFVAREGRLMQDVAMAWARGQRNVDARYLVLSRRAVVVPLLESETDILEVAKPDYWPSPVGSFIENRFGATPSAARWREVGWTPDRTLEIRRGDLREIEPLLKALTPDILAQARAERSALDLYLSQTGLFDHAKSALVDVGYSGTIQRHVNRVLPRAVNGYYVMTNERAERTANAVGAFARGCFCEGIEHKEGVGPLMYWRSFELEKLLSSNDPQVVRYIADARERAQPSFRALHPDESASATVRSELQAGVMQFVADARDVRETMLPDWRPSTAVAQQLFEALVANPSASESDVLRAIALDDHHHGRGVVR